MGRDAGEDKEKKKIIDSQTQWHKNKKKITSSVVENFKERDLWRTKTANAYWHGS